MRLIEHRMPLWLRLWRTTGKARYVAGVLAGIVTIQFLPVVGGLLLASLAWLAMGYTPNFD